MSEQPKHEDPRLVEVIDKHGFKEERTVLHRADDDAGCSKRPETDSRTDLTTAAVAVNDKLCNDCVWPDGAEEVLHGQ